MSCQEGATQGAAMSPTPTPTPTPPGQPRRPASAPAARVVEIAAYRPAAALRPCSAVATPLEQPSLLQRQPSEVDSTWRDSISRGTLVDRKLSRDVQRRSADRGLLHIAQRREMREQSSARARQHKQSATHRAWHEQAWARHEEQLQARQTSATTARLQRAHHRHTATKQWRNEHGTRTRHMVASPGTWSRATAAAGRARPTLSGPVQTPEDNQREALMRAQIDGAQSMLAKERFARAQLPHEQSLAAHEKRYRRVRAIMDTTAARDLCDRHQIDGQREFVFSEGRQSLQLTMRTTLGLELTQRSRANHG